MLLAQAVDPFAGERGGGPFAPARAERAQRIADHRQIDDFLHDRPRQCRQMTRHGQQHGQE